MSKLIDADRLREFLVSQENYCTSAECLTDVIHNYLDKAPDLSLTIDDLKRLDALLYAVKYNKTMAFTFTSMSDEKYEEVVRRFNEQKK